MKKGIKFLIVALLFLPFSGSAQTDTLIKKLDSLTRKTDSAGGQKNNINSASYNAATNISLSNYFLLLGSDLKQEFTKPFHMVRKDWQRLGKFAVVLVALGVADEGIQKAMVRLTRDKPSLRSASAKISKFGGPYEFYTLATIAATGLIFKNQKMFTTTLLATQAYITGGALESVTKFLSGRTRPSYYDPGVEAEPKFLGPLAKTTTSSSGKKVYSAFPSGHTTVAFAAATVFASEYKNYPFVPIIAYSAATLIGISRLTENKHWATDVLTGVVIGILSGKNVVNNYHRFVKIKAPQIQKNAASF